MFIVPMDTPGIKLMPMDLMSDHDINQVFYDDVRVPASALVGGENNGWGLITNQLNRERVTLCSSGIIERALTDTRRWAPEPKLADGRRVIDQEWVQVHLARIHARLEFLRLANWKVAWDATQKRLDVADASTIKVFGTEFYLEAFRLMFEVVGQPGYLKQDAPDSVLKSRLERYYRSLIILTFGGGVSEEQEATRDLARQILSDRETHEHLKELEAGGEGFDRDTWAELAKAGLLGIALPEASGGSGLGFVALCRLFEEIGRTVAPVPVLPAVVLGALPIAQFGTDAQKQQYLPGIVAGDTVLTAALVETGTDALHPTTTARVDGDGWRVDGVKTCVPAGLVADRVLVPASAGDDGTIVVLIVDPNAKGVKIG